jgi:hypothetical protein
MDHTCESMSRIALNMEAKNCRQGKDHNCQSAACFSCNTLAELLKPHNKSCGHEQCLYHFRNRGCSEISTGDSKRQNGVTLCPDRGPHKNSINGGWKADYECKHYSKKCHLAKDCKALVPVCMPSEAPKHGKAKAQKT